MPATIALSACGGASSAAPAATPTSLAAAAPTTVVAVATSAASTSPTVVAAASTAKVSANTASVDDLQQAFEAAGIPSAARWAREVDEYRPYDTADPSMAKLRSELAKYNPAPGVVDQIVAHLSLS